VFFELLIVLVIIFHTIACCWMRIGLELEDSWIAE